MLQTHVIKAAVAPPSDEAATLRERGALVRLEHELRHGVEPHLVRVRVGARIRVRVRVRVRASVRVSARVRVRVNPNHRSSHTPTSSRFVAGAMRPSRTC